MNFIDINKYKMSFKEKFYGKTTVIGKSGLFDAISSFKYPVNKTCSLPQEITKYMRSSNIVYKIQQSPPSIERASLILKNTDSNLGNPAHSISQIQLKIRDIGNINSPHKYELYKLLSERRHETKLNSPQEFSRKAQNLQEIAFRNINHDLIEANRSKFKSKAISQAKGIHCRKNKK
jgi:hypothetical protein